MSIKEALIKATKTCGLKLSQLGRQSENKSPASGHQNTPPKLHPDISMGNGRHSKSSSGEGAKKSGKRKKKSTGKQNNVGNVKGASKHGSCYGGGRLLSGKTEKEADALPDYTLEIDEGSVPELKINVNNQGYEYSLPNNPGVSTQLIVDDWVDEREVMIGLDFGTSSVKLIIGDDALGKAFAVKFGNRDNIDGYILPSRLFESEKGYSLYDGERSYRDLKLSLLSSLDERESRLRVVAFLALVMRHARGWLFSEQELTYRNTRIYWKVALGIPSSNNINAPEKSVFSVLAAAAWLASVSNARALTPELVSELLAYVEGLDKNHKDQELNNVEIAVVPEIAAQIYGYVASNRFDKNGRNLYLMVDVGAGTVDSSLFKVKEDRGGKFGFEFYTSQVQPLGVMNLHRHRMQWWISSLAKKNIGLNLHGDQLEDIIYATDVMQRIPEHYSEYFSHVKVFFSNQQTDPDRVFFSKVKKQAWHQTMWKAWEKNLVQKHQIKDVPLFICGGGSRMKFYKRLEDEMRAMPGYTWLSTDPQQIELPKRLVAPGIRQEDYDRFTVAFGLSFLRVSEVSDKKPIVRQAKESPSLWRENYIDKDMC